MEWLIRFLIGGAVVSLFATAADILRPTLCRSSYSIEGCRLLYECQPEHAAMCAR
jgi:hypothetical protein